MKRAAIYAHYGESPKVALYVFYFLKEIRSLGFEICFVSNSPISPESQRELSTLCQKFIQRENNGFDFAMWQAGLAEYDLSMVDELLLTNSSIIGPLQPLAPLWKNPSVKDCDFWGLTDNDELGLHLQSYFLVFRRQVIHSASFGEFWRSVLPHTDKQRVIQDYEIGLTRHLEKAGFKWLAIFTQQRLWSLFLRRRNLRKKIGDWYCARPLPGRNTTTLLPDLLVKCGMPFVKAALLQERNLQVSPKVAVELLEASSLPAEVLEDLHLKKKVQSEGSSGTAGIVKKIFKRLFGYGRTFAKVMPTLLEELLPHNSLPLLIYRVRFARQKAKIKNVRDGFSLVIATRNRKKFLAWSVAAILANTQEPFEIIIVDNASDDGTDEMCRELERKHPGVIRHVRLNRNYGTNAYALGFLFARYKYLVDVDDDILAVSKGWDSATAKAFSVIPRLGFLSMNVVQDKYTNGSKPDISNYSESIFSDTTLETGPAGGWFAVTTRAIYNEAGGFIFRPYKPFHLEDGQFVGEISKKGYASGILKGKFVYHASGAYWNSAYGYNKIWHEKYRRDHKNFLPAIAAVQVEEVPSVEYSQAMVAKAEKPG
jgi:GT2 family glycosyltransferase